MKTLILSLFFFFIVSSANARDPAFCNGMYLMVKVYYEGVSSTAFEDQYDILSSRAYEDPYFGVTANCLQTLQSSGKGNYIHVFERNYNVFVYIENQYDGDSGYCFNGLEKMVGFKPPKRIENILREDCAVHSF